VINQFGADCVRWYLYTVNSAGDPKRFDLKDVKDKYNRFFGTLYNTLVFFQTYIDKSFRPSKSLKPKNILDRWIISGLNSLVLEMTSGLENYDVVGASRAFEKFIDELSNWYVRRSRRRFQKPESEREKNEAAQTLYYVLLNLAKLAAPFIPFLSEEIYLSLKKSKMDESVHLCDWPPADKKLINKNLEGKMAAARQIVALALADRASAGIKVRQPLATLEIKNKKSNIKNDRELFELIKDEVNIKEIRFNPELKTEIKLDKKITNELKEEGLIRELVRQIQDMRRQAGLTRKDRIGLKLETRNLKLEAVFKNWADFIYKETLSQQFDETKGAKAELEKDIQLDEEKVKVSIKKIK